jgi:hypothetical protein
MLQADILMVTDGEIAPPDEDIKNRLKYAHEERGLEVRGRILHRMAICNIPRMAQAPLTRSQPSDLHQKVMCSIILKLPVVLVQVHGLLVGRDDSGSPAMQEICTHLHTFQSWTAVGGRDIYY